MVETIKTQEVEVNEIISDITPPPPYGLPYFNGGYLMLRVLSVVNNDALKCKVDQHFKIFRRFKIIKIYHICRTKVYLK